MKEIQCTPLRSRPNHPLSIERQKAARMKASYEGMKTAAAALGIAASMMAGALLAVASAAGFVQM